MMPMIYWNKRMSLITREEGRRSNRCMGADMPSSAALSDWLPTPLSPSTLIILSCLLFIFPLSSLPLSFSHPLPMNIHSLPFHFPSFLFPLHITHFLPTHCIISKSSLSLNFQFLSTLIFLLLLLSFLPLASLQCILISLSLFLLFSLWNWW